MKVCILIFASLLASASFASGQENIICNNLHSNSSFETWPTLTIMPGQTGTFKLTKQKWHGFQYKVFTGDLKLITETPSAVTYDLLIRNEELLGTAQIDLQRMTMTFQNEDFICQ